MQAFRIADRKRRAFSCFASVSQSVSHNAVRCSVDEGLIKPTSSSILRLSCLVFVVCLQWTMDSLKGTVVLFTPHTSQVINKDAARACSSEAAASKLFKASVGLHTVGHLPIPIHGTPRLPIPIHGRKCKNMTQKLTFGSRSVASYLARQCCFQSVMKTLRHSAQRLLVLGLPVVLWTVMWCLVYLEFA